MFRSKKEMVGLLLGSVCFFPSFLASWKLGLINFTLGLIILSISQFSWLLSIHLCTQSLEYKNKELKEKLRIKEGDNNA